MLKEIFPNSIEIEDVRRCSLADSLTESYYITGLRSTVLSQAYFSGKQIVIDDLSMRQEYLELKRRKYIIISRPHQLLSEIAESVKNGMDYDETYRFKICRENG